MLGVLVVVGGDARAPALSPCLRLFIVADLRKRAGGVQPLCFGFYYNQVCDDDSRDVRPPENDVGVTCPRNRRKKLASKGFLYIFLVRAERLLLFHVFIFL